MRKCIQLVLCLIAVAAWMGCSVKQGAPLFEQPGLAAKVQSGEYVQVVDNFLILLDNSHSMRDPYQGEAKFFLAQSAALSLNQTLAGLKLNGGLRTFGDLSFSAAPRTQLICPVAPYSASSYADCINSVSPSFGSTPLYDAMVAASGDIANLKGNTAIIVISDGNFTGGNVAEAVSQLTQAYGDRVCISSITIGRSGSLSALTSQTRCGKYSFFDDVKTSDGMVGFVTDVFLEKGAPKPVVAPAKMIINSVLFDFDSSAIKPEAAIVLKEAASVLKQSKGAAVLIEGHTCSIGSEQYNQGLSERRACSVKTFLVEQGIAETCLTTRGVGEDRPVADNTTEDGRRRNRRVEFHVTQ
jgi:OmpA-OmpF porin, OOP family